MDLVREGPLARYRSDDAPKFFAWRCSRRSFSCCGPCGDPRLVDPAWTSGNVRLATSGADFARGVQWGAYDGSLFVAQLRESDLRRFTFAGAVATQHDVFFDGTYGRVRTVRQGRDGSLYLTTSNGSGDRVIRITPTQ